MGIVRRVLLLGLIVAVDFTASSANAAPVLPTGVFTGDYLESWETFPTGPKPTTLTILGGTATITHPDFYIYQPGTFSTFDLGTSGSAKVADGAKGIGVNSDGATTTIDFSSPISMFGAFWGAATRPDFSWHGVVSVAFYDSSSVLIDTQTFVYDHSATGNGQLDWHGWISPVGVSRVTFTGDYIVNDSIRVDLQEVAAVPEPTSLLLFGTGVAALAAKARRRKK